MCLVVDSGYSFTHIVPVFNGKVLKKGVKRYGNNNNNNNKKKKNDNDTSNNYFSHYYYYYCFYYYYYTFPSLLI